MYAVNMKPVEGFEKVIIGENQTKDYDPLPALRSPQGFVLIEMALSDEDRAHLAAGGRVRFFQWSGGRPFAPIAFEVIPADKILPVEPVQ